MVKALLRSMIERLNRNLRARVDELVGDSTELEAILKRGAERAREVSVNTLANVYERLGFLQVP